MDLYIFAMRGSGAESFVNWLYRSIPDSTVYDCYWTADGRFFSDHVVGSGADVFKIAFCQDEPLRKTDAPAVVCLNNLITTLSTRLGNPNQYANNVDHIATDRWKEHARQFRLQRDYINCNLEEWFESAAYRAELAAKLDVEFDPLTETTDDLKGHKFRLHRTTDNDDLKAALDNEALTLNYQIYGDTTPIEPGDNRSSTNLFNEGYRRYKLGEFEQAASCWERSLNMDEQLSTRGNLCTAYTALRRWDDAQRMFESINLEDNPKASTDYFFFQRLQGKDPDLQLYEQRPQLQRLRHKLGKAFEYPVPPVDPKTTFHVGDPDDYPCRGGRHFYWIGEQGLGDQIQYARYLPNWDDDHYFVTAVVSPELVPLFKTIPRVHAIPGWAIWDEPKKKTFQWLGSMSAPLHFGAKPYTFNVSPLFETKDKAIGICWQGSRRHVDDHWRSCNRELLKPLEQCGELFPLDHAADFLALARIVVSLDCVVTVDTAVAHLAGALGVPTYLMLSWKQDSRWGLEGERTALYDSVRIVRQERLNDWLPVVRNVAERIDTDAR